MKSSVANRRMLANSLHHLPPGSVAKRRTNPNRWLELTLGVRRRKPLPDLSALDSKRPGERTYMTRDQLRSEFGSDPAAIAAIEKFAAAHHLVVTRNEPASARLGVGGTVADISQAFGVKLLDYSHPKLGDFHARTGPVMLPTELGDAITGVFGLNNQRVMHRLPRRRQSVDPRLAASSQSRSWFVPTELAQIYNFPDADASGQCIGLLEFGGGVEQSDVTAYFQKIGAPAPAIQIVAVDGVGAEAQVQDGHAHVNFPATSPYVLAVGGTTLHAPQGANGQMAVSEVVWNDGPGSGTGGGVSDITPAPGWQEGKVPRSLNPGNFAGRAIPDVAANADPATGYLVMNGGKFGIVGGTSAAAPLWASLITRTNALTGARAGNFNALLYGTIGPAGVLRDITSGNNDTDGLLDGQFAAGPGWDACTGWGAPDGVKLLAALKSPSR